MMMMMMTMTMMALSWWSAEAFVCGPTIITTTTMTTRDPSSRVVRRRRMPSSFTSSGCVRDDNNNNNDNDNDNDNHPKSIGDVVQGLHGSKYQFHDAGINFEGQQFAEMGYSSSYNDDDEDVDNYNYLQQEPIPNWALRLQELPLPPNAPILDITSTGSSSSSSSSGGCIDIQNDERSWEVFYAFVRVIVMGDGGPRTSSDSDSSSDHRHLTIHPRVGQLAPRGGVNQFSDTATLQVQCKKKDHDGVAVVSSSSSSSFVASDVEGSWLVVGTEAEKWFYRLV